MIIYFCLVTDKPDYGDLKKVIFKNSERMLKLRTQLLQVSKLSLLNNKDLIVIKTVQ